MIVGRMVPEKFRYFIDVLSKVRDLLAWMHEPAEPGATGESDLTLVYEMS